MCYTYCALNRLIFCLVLQLLNDSLQIPYLQEKQLDTQLKADSVKETPKDVDNHNDEEDNDNEPVDEVEQINYKLFADSPIFPYRFEHLSMTQTGMNFTKA